MRRPTRTATLAAAMVIAGAAHAEPPAALIESIEEANGFCTSLGGTPTLQDGYLVERDLNGDGTADFITDLAHLQCAGAPSAFCASAGCPVSAWLSRDDGGFDRFDFAYLQQFEVLDQGGDLPAVVASYHGSFCGDAAGADGCTRTWVFAENDPAEPPIDGGASAPVATSATLASSSEEAAPTAAAPTMVAPGWTLREVPGSSPVALGGGVGNVASLAAFCLSGQPFLAVTFLERPPTDSTVLEFDFTGGAAEVTARYEPTAGGAFVVDLAETALARQLGGRDREVDVAVGGTAQGILSLSGSTRALRNALADCGGL